MIRIYEESADGRQHAYSFDDFRARFLEICAEHRDEGRARAFAFLMHDWENPEVTKMLGDPLYWRALHEISGRDLSVFSFHLTTPEPPAEEQAVYWVGGVLLSDPAAGARQMLESYFDLSEPPELPALVFFQTDADRVTDYCLVRLASRQIEETFNEVRELLGIAAQGAREAGEGETVSGEEVFRAIQNGLRKRRIKANLKRGVEALREVKDAVGLFSFLG